VVVGFRGFILQKVILVVSVYFCKKSSHISHFGEVLFGLGLVWDFVWHF
jgi:hypothetical protein